MNGETLLEKLTNIDDDLIEEAGNIHQNGKRYKYKNKFILAASLCLILVGSNVLWRIDANNKKENIDIAKEVSSYKVDIPPLTLSSIEDSNEVNGQFSKDDKVGVVIFNGNIYTQSQYYSGDEIGEINDLIGEFLGYAKGNIDDEYTNELASTMKGSVYTVKGYDKDFRICMESEDIGDNGELVQNIKFFERLNGIGLNTGKDLYEDRLKISSNWSSIEYLDERALENGIKNYKDLINISSEDVEKFLAQLNASEFEDLSGTNIYSKENHHIYLNMKDGTTVELILFEGGYVGYQALGEYLVKMPGQIFDKLYNKTSN